MIVCDASVVALATPYMYWRERDGSIELVFIPAGPSELAHWNGCDCDAGSPFACFVCDTGFACSETDHCADAGDAEACASAGFPDAPCNWVDANFYESDGSGCVLATAGRCVGALSDAGDCSLASPPPVCAAWPDEAPAYVRPLDGGGIELIHWPTCDDAPWGYMPCWSAPGDPPACTCAC
jgi:hypothetical protein